MIEWFTAPGSGPFTAAVLTMLGLAAFEVVALLLGLSAHEVIDDFVSSSAGLEPTGPGAAGPGAAGPETVGAEAVAGDAAGADAAGLVGRVLAWFYFGRVPALVILIVFLTVFGLAGLVLQGVLRDLVGAALPAVLAMPIVGVASLPAVRWISGGLARILPRDETSAIDRWTFVGRTATLVGPGVARAGLPAQARLVDPFGTEHYLMVEPLEADDAFAPGDVVRLVYETEGGRFTALHARDEEDDDAAPGADRTAR